jgi:hypothetical protein
MLSLKNTAIFFASSPSDHAAVLWIAVFLVLSGKKRLYNRRFIDETMGVNCGFFLKTLAEDFKMQKGFLVVLLMGVFIVASSGFAVAKSVGESAKDAGQSISTGAKDVGKDVKEGAQQVGRDASAMGKEVGKGFEKGGKEVGDGFKKGADDVGKGFKEGAKGAGK